jgi:ABC-2 type transport system ATP-binding protein
MMDQEHSQAVIKVENLVKEFKGFRAVDDISFEVKKGETFAFLGPNGAGKTTTIKMLTTMLLPTSGKVLINGFDPLTQQSQVRDSFGIVFQDQTVDEELTARENMELHGVLYGVEKKLMNERIEELLHIVELWDKRQSYVKTFSGGMRRRLEIARALLHHPKIVFLDEPTVGLDPQTRNNIWSHIEDLSKKEDITVFFTTHYMEEAEKMSQHIFIIDHGKIVAHGTSDQLKGQTHTSNLEDAFLALTGKAIRDEEGSSEFARQMMKRRFR